MVMLKSGMFTLESGFRRRVVLVVAPRDAYTMKPVAGPQLQVRLADPVLGKPIVKAEGYYVFTDLEDRKVEVVLESLAYCSERIEVDLRTLSKPYMLTVLLRPSRRYPADAGTTLLSGVCRIKDMDKAGKDLLTSVADLDVECILTTPRKKIKFLERKDSEHIALYSGNTDLSFRRLAYKKDKENFGLVVLSRQVGPEVYQLAAECDLPVKALKRGQELLPISMGKTDEKGFFFIPVVGVSQASEKAVFLAYSGKQVYACEVEVVAGQHTYLPDVEVG